MKNIIFFLLLTITFCTKSYAQYTIDMNVDTTVQKMYSHYIGACRREFVEGWSIQILVTDDRYKAEDAKVSFLTRHPDMKAYLEYEAPTYRLKVGCYVNKSSAVTSMKQLYSEYPDAYISINKKIKPIDLI